MLKSFPLCRRRHNYTGMLRVKRIGNANASGQRITGSDPDPENGTSVAAERTGVQQLSGISMLPAYLIDAKRQSFASGRRWRNRRQLTPSTPAPAYSRGHRRSYGTPSCTLTPRRQRSLLAR